MATRRLTLGKDLVIIRQLSAFDPLTKLTTNEAAAGLVATCRIAAASGEEGDATPPPEIHLDLKYAPMEDGGNGYVYCIVTGVQSLARLKSYIRKKVYACVTVAGTKYIDFEPLLVVGNSLVDGAEE